MDVVPDADGQLGLASTLDICFGSLALTDLVLGNSVGKASKKNAGTSRLVIVNCKCHISLFVVEFEFLRHGELLADSEELRIELWFSILKFMEVVLDGDW